MILTSENYAAKAEAVMKKLCNEKDIKGRDVEPVTTSKIRNLLSMTADIYNEVVNCKEDRLPVYEDTFCLRSWSGTKGWKACSGGTDLELY